MTVRIDPDVGGVLMGESMMADDYRDEWNEYAKAEELPEGQKALPEQEQE